MRHLCKCLIANVKKRATKGNGKNTAATVLIMGSSFIYPSIDAVKEPKIIKHRLGAISFFSNLFELLLLIHIPHVICPTKKNKI